MPSQLSPMGQVMQDFERNQRMAFGTQRYLYTHSQDKALASDYHPSYDA